VHLRYGCIALFILPYVAYALHSVCRTIYFFIPIFSLVCLEKNLYMYIMGMTEKAHRTAFFCLGISKPLSLRKCLILPHKLGLDILLFSSKHVFVVFCLFFQYIYIYIYIKKKKKKGISCIIFFFDSFSDIARIFS
jgi:hypothetical protein